MKNEEELRFIFRKTVEEFLSKPDLKLFCQKYGYDVKTFNKGIKDYVEHYAEPSEIKTYEKYKKFLNYEKVFNFLLKTNNQEKMEEVLNYYIDCYGQMRKTYISLHSVSSSSLKKVDMAYRKCLENIKGKEDGRKNIEKKPMPQLLIDKFDAIFTEVDNQIQNNCYYVSDLLDKARKLASSKFYLDLDKYRDKINYYYKVVLDCVLSEYEKQPESFTLIDYFYITDVQPKYLLREVSFRENKENVDRKNKCNNILRQICNGYQLNLYFEKFNANNISLIISNYKLNDGQLSSNDMLELYEFMKEENLPKYNTLLIELVKKYALDGSLEYRRKNSENNFVLSKKRV